MIPVLNDAIIVIGVIVKIYGDSGGNEEFLYISHIQLLFVRGGNSSWKFYCFFSLLNHSNPVTALTVMIWVRIAHKTSALTAHLSFIRGWPKPARKYRGMRFPWPPGMLSHRMHKSQPALQR